MVIDRNKEAPRVKFMLLGFLNLIGHEMRYLKSRKQFGTTTERTDGNEGPKKSFFLMQLNIYGVQFSVVILKNSLTKKKT